ncbi:MAG: aminotransferase class V-fold PLP-dependent enzyme [Oscillospiraceae bacterium]|nr:aminotransferase class V-fold PLP-dependent enzyme [Oscillospiraceae bacterium]
MVNGISYFDNAATTFPKPEEVYSFMDKFYRECGVNAGRGQHRLSAKANALIEETRKLLLDLFHCINKKVVFTSTATEAINLILSGIDIPEKSTVYISPFEHNAVTRMLHYLQKKTDFSIEQLAVSKETKAYDTAKISEQFKNKKPFCVIVSHASNVCGAVAPIEYIFSEAKQSDAVTIVDMCQTAGLIDTDLSSDIYDFAVFEGHKTLYGPMGIGGFVCKPSVSVPPLIYGGTGVESANQDMPDEVPVKYEAGSHNISATAGLNAALKWIMKTGIEKIYSEEQTKKERLVSVLKSYSNINVIEPEESIGVVSCTFDGYSSDNIGQVLSDHDIAVRTGLHCSPYAHKFLETFPAGTVRFSLNYFNDDTDFERLNEVLEYIEENS